MEMACRKPKDKGKNAKQRRMLGLVSALLYQNFCNDKVTALYFDNNTFLLWKEKNVVYRRSYAVRLPTAGMAVAFVVF